MADIDVRYQKTTREVRRCPPCPPPPRRECPAHGETVHPLVLVAAIVGALIAIPVGVGFFEGIRSGPILGGIVGCVIGFFGAGGIAAALAEAARGR